MEKLFELIKYLFLGVFQGFTEPIPISSSGHLVIVQELFKMDEQGLTFEVLVNFGSLIAVLMVYRKDLIRLIKNGLAFLVGNTRNEDKKNDSRFIIYLIIGTIPAAILGILLEDWIGNTFGDKAKMVGITLIITGVALWIIRNLKGIKGDHDITWIGVIIVGLAQAVALIPGISRSGATIVAAMLLGWKQETALRFSFLLFIPVSLGTVVLSVGDLMAQGEAKLIPYILAFLGSIIASYYALRWFMNIMAKGNLKYFSFYCFIVGALVFIFM
ncbi:UDP pyrophosphate phosphatase [Pontibacillus yanchengensis]|uniref:UDP pyrophosphate phosphatase n=2 Tax=Pontibacillus yanchengensis TaxID=462910 RepID=A0ACC7VF91_9BACI|nr:undecaprenyl-diphosphate phosphatase [Pontibacillus yanchengensis]MYL32249.1 UDP pyrophosphate phosphatase [Pontibacillus yanchengensis]MYL52829.1 UDP pyrophosphate phosphatase [Pontibacillus yanchengensis]